MDLEQLNQLVGKLYVKQGQLVSNLLLDLSKTKTFTELDLQALQYRILEPGQIMTRDYRPERVNIFLDENNICNRVSLG